MKTRHVKKNLGVAGLGASRVGFLIRGAEFDRPSALAFVPSNQVTNLRRIHPICQECRREATGLEICGFCGSPTTLIGGAR